MFVGDKKMKIGAKNYMYVFVCCMYFVLNDK